jgi:uncharacterized membrane protein
MGRTRGVRPIARASIPGSDPDDLQFFPGILEPSLAWPLALAALALLACSVPGLKEVRAAPVRIHLLLGSAVGLAVLWLIRARVDPGLGLHILGVTTVTMLLGWRLALVATALAEVATVVVSVHEALVPGVLAAGWLVSGVVPASISYAVARAARFHLPRNLFVYLFICCFFGSALAVAAAWLGGLALLWASGHPPPVAAGDSLPAFLPLVLFPEAFINGALMTLLAVYRPDWVRLFDDTWYLDR